MKLKNRAILDEVLSHKPNKPLYHYTTQAGLLGIIKSKQLWATHNQYLNDRRELLHALDLIRAEVDRLLMGISLGDPNGGVREMLLTNMQSSLKYSSEGINVCVSSFSEDGDSLSQWRAYSGSSGFAVGFDPGRLKAAADSQKWYLAPCVYDPERQNTIVRALIEEVLEEILSGDKPDESWFPDLETFKTSTGNFLPYLYRYAPILKDRSFAEEREWRFISRPLMCNSEGFDYREGRSTIVPYYKFPLCDSYENFPLHEIVIGPTRDAERSTRSITSLWISKNIPRADPSEIPVTVSKVPYRDW